MEKSIKMIACLCIILSSFLFQSCSNGPVDKGLLDDISKMEHSLQISCDFLATNSGGLEKRIQRTVEDGGSKPADVAVLDKAINIRSSTSDVREFIDKLKKQIIQTTGGYIDGDPVKGYLGASDMSITETIMIGSDQGPAVILKQKVNKCVIDYGKIMEKNYSFTPIETSLFKGKPMVVTMANLTRIEFDLLTYENNLLQDLGAQVGF